MKNRKSYFKRFLSTLLVLCMMAAFIPAAFAADTAEETKNGIKVVYDFDEFALNTPLQSITFENSGGRMEFLEESNDDEGDIVTETTYTNIQTEAINYASLQLNQKGRYMAFKIRVPKNKTYDVALNYLHSHKASNNIVVGNNQTTGMWILPADTQDIETVTYSGSAAEKLPQLVQVAGTNVTAESKNTTTLETLKGEFKSGEEEEYLLVFVRTETGNSNKLKVVSIELSEKDLETNEVYENLEEVSFENEKETVSQKVYKLSTVLGDESASPTTPAEVNIVDGYATVSADETDLNGNKFLYWVKGLQTGVGVKVLSTVRENYKFKPSNGNNYIIAVYGNPNAEFEKKYFNANGQPLPNGPEEVSMPGYGTTSNFKDCGFGVYTAVYDEANEETYTITVNNRDSSGVIDPPVTKTAKFGEKVTVTTEASYKSGTKTYAFLCWKRTANGVTEVVSFDREYTFSAFEDCTMTAVYNRSSSAEAGKDAFRQIILTNLDGNQFMAEFIGFGDAVEKGIAIGNKRVAMTTNLTMFTLDAETTEGVKGYAIDKDGKVYYAD